MANPIFDLPVFWLPGIDVGRDRDIVAGTPVVRNADGTISAYSNNANNDRVAQEELQALQQRNEETAEQYEARIRRQQEYIDEMMHMMYEFRIPEFRNPKVKILDPLKKINYNYNYYPQKVSKLKVVGGKIFCKGCRRLKTICDLNCEQILKNKIIKSKSEGRLFFEDFLKDEILRSNQSLLHCYAKDITLKCYTIKEEVRALGEKDIVMYVSYQIPISRTGQFHQSTHLNLIVSEDTRIYEMEG